jgi:DNA-binding transcriptional LysR family regulator
MDIFQLKAFQTLAECQSYTAAAKKLFISQSYLSKLISKLEDELDTKLFKRGRKKKPCQLKRA